MQILILQGSPRAKGNTEFRDICNYRQVENMGHVTAKIDEQKTEATKQKIVELVGKL